jgi:hypothetical protein
MHAKCLENGVRGNLPGPGIAAGKLAQKRSCRRFAGITPVLPVVREGTARTPLRAGLSGLSHRVLRGGRRSRFLNQDVSFLRSAN